MTYREALRPGFTALLIGLALTSLPVASAEPRPVFSPPPRFSARIGQGIGPPGAEVRTLAMAPTDPDRLYAGTWGGHLFASFDGAGFWRESRPPIPQDALLGKIAVRPDRPDTVFATFWRPGGGGGLLRSTDGGTSWERVQSVGSPPLRAIAIAPSEPDTLYAGGPLGVWRSSNGGISWEDASGVETPLREIESLAVDPRSSLRVFAGTWRQAYRSSDGGRSWMRIGEGMDLDRDIFTITLSPDSPEVLYAGTCGFIYASLDGGGSWSAKKGGIPSDHRRIHSISVDPLRPCTLWAGTRGGLYRSMDCGSSFELEIGGISVSSVLADPADGRVFAGTEELGILSRQGSTPFRESNSGMNASKVAAFDACSNLELIVAARTGRPGFQTIHVTRDGGRTWDRLAGGMDFEGVRFLRVLDLVQQPRVLVITRDSTWWELALNGGARRISPPSGRLTALRWVEGRGILLAATDQGLFVLRRGNSAAPHTGSDEESPWVRLRSGSFATLAVGGSRYMALGPGTVARGLFPELVEGKGPEVIETTGLQGVPVDCSLAPADDAAAYAITEGKVYRSLDFGGSWTPVALPWPARNLLRVTSDPTHQDRAVALDAHGAILFGGGESETWRVLGYDPWLRPAQEIALSSTEPGVALVGTIGHGLRVVSLDGISYGTEEIAFARPPLTP